MKIGTTSIVLVKLEVDVTKVSKIIWTLKSDNTTITKNYPNDVTYADGYFGLPLTQENTTALGEGIVRVEGQVNYSDKAVAKTETISFRILPTLATEVVTGNAPTGGIEPEELKVKISGDVIIAQATGGGSGTWGSITGTLSDQTDLKAALDSKANTNQIPSLNGYATESYVTNAISDKADRSEIPSLTGYATQNWVQNQGYTTSEIDDNTTGVTNTWSASKINQNLSDLNTTVASKANASDLATKGDKTQVDANTNDINRLYKLTQGQTWDFEEQTETGTNVAPSGAVYESLLSVDGKTEQNTYTGINIFPNTTVRRGTFSVNLPQGTRLKWVSLNPITQAVGNFRLWNADSSQSQWLGVGGSVKTNSGACTLNFDCDHIEDLMEEDFNRADVCLGIGNDVTYEPYVGGIPSPSPSYPQEIVGITELNITVDGETKKITPPKTMLICGTKKDYLNIEDGKWHWNIKEIASADYGYNCHTDEEHFVVDETTANINTSDLAYLKTLQGIDADKEITITDQNGNDVSYLLEYIVKLGGTTVNE